MGTANHARVSDCPDNVAPHIARRSVAPEDGEILLKIFAGAQADEMELLDWPQDQKAGFLKQQYQAQKQSYDIHYPGAVHEIILRDGRPAGHLWVERNKEEIRLLDIAFLPEYRGQGMGSLLIRELQEETARAGKPMRHCVLKTNWGARRFYERLGFAQVSDLEVYVMMEWGQASPRPAL